MLAAELPGSAPLGLRAYLDLDFELEASRLCLNGKCLHPDGLHHEGPRITFATGSALPARWICSVCVEHGWACS